MTVRRPALGAGTPLPGLHRPEQQQGLSRLPAAQQPPWANHPDLACIRAELADLPALVVPDEIRALRRALARVESGSAFLLHVGECAETFAMADTDNIAARLSLYEQMADWLADRTGRETVLVARMAGQHAKPRSEATEALPDGIVLPVYRGDAVNGTQPTPLARRADPWRLLTAYDRSQDTLRQLQAQAGPGRRPVFVSHEALLRDYEEPFTRGGFLRYAASGHLVWVGERTRGPADWHVRWAASVANPIGVKLGPSVTTQEAVDLVRLLNPEQEQGRLNLIARMGAAVAADRLTALSRAVAGTGSPLLWQCDPMHGNTRKSGDRKLRLLPDVRAEISAFVRTLTAAGCHPGGLHLEVTPDVVAECHEDLSSAPGSGPRPPCDPRLNPAQALAVVDHFATETNHHQ
ncbi:3-deoxy-7-phosphoheptulonate synthase [Streptomyces sp. NPDC005374]|uniref:3-deoxy-7-phosphoheptulonate synthase n=1 Tax=Streptomyces sp. NPDC005374 TaxID=3364713 RepID=UPI0036A3A011